MKRLKIALLAVFVMSGALFVFHGGRAFAASGACYFAGGTGPTVSGGTCYAAGPYGSYGTNDVLTGRSTSGSGKAIPDTVNTKTEFINFIENRFNSANTHDKIGAAFIIQEMRSNTDHSWPSGGDVTQWENLLQQSSVSVSRTWDGSVGRTSYYDPGKKNTFYAYHPVVGREVIKVVQNGRLIAEIETGCGNMVAGPIAIAAPRWTLSADSSVSPANSAPGQTVQFAHTVTNNGPDDMDDALDAYVEWVSSTGPGVRNGVNVETCNDGNGLDGSGPGSKRKCNAGPLSFTIPNSASDGDVYCQQVWYRPKTRGDNTFYHSTKACVTIKDWHITGSSRVPGTVQACGTVTWTHKVWNDGGRQSATVSGDVHWGTGGSITTGIVAGQNYSKVFSAGESVMRQPSFTVPCGTPVGTQYCQYITWDKTSATDSRNGRSAPACTKVIDTGGNKVVELQGNVTANGQTETTTDASFSGYVHVSGFPTPTVGGWGYNELSQRQAAQRTGSSITTVGLQTQSRQGSSTTTQSTSNIPYPCAGNPNNTCYKCPSGYTKTGSGSSSTCTKQVTTYYTEYRYRCVDPNAGSWTAWGASKPTCKDYYTCDYGAAGSGWYYSSPTCQGWRCRYPDTPQYNQATQPTCEYRCTNGTGSRAYGDDGSGFQRNCYVQPQFRLDCDWSNGDSYSATVRADGDYCQSNITETAGGISSCVQATLTPEYPDGWQANPQPGFGQDVNGNWKQLNVWTWHPDVGQDCSQVIGKPYVKIYGGDTRVGGGVGVNTTSCTTNPNAGIKAYNRSSDGSYAGAGTQYASMAMAIVSGFAAAQYNHRNANPNVGTSPTALAFANNTGSEYGGEFGDGGAPACVGYVESLSSDAQQLTGDQTLGGSTFGSNQSLILHVKGNVFINSNITYAPSNWVSASQIPQFELVVEGNIYVAGTVSQLDGLYAAIPTSTTSGGHIYTCATGIGSVPTSTFTGQCTHQLVVNGSFAAKQVHFLRDCSSLVHSYADEPTLYTGQADGNLCSGANHAAEVFNYTPEQWIRSSVGPTPNKYDAISSMPPIL